MRPVAIFVILLSLGACKKDGPPKSAEPTGPVVKKVTVTPPPGRVVEMTPIHQQVVKRLNQDGMLRIPEVRAKSEELMKEIGKNGVTISGQAIIFDKWLDEYSAKHSQEVDAAKRQQDSATKAFMAATKTVPAQTRAPQAMAPQTMAPRPRR